jgi:hypothetical protein
VLESGDWYVCNLSTLQEKGRRVKLTVFAIRFIS